MDYKQTEQVVRLLRINREGREVIYPFTINSGLFFAEAENEVQAALFKYLIGAFYYGCPPGKSVSQAEKLVVDIVQKPSFLQDFAALANYTGNKKFQHDLVEQYFLRNDEYTVAIEVPVADDVYRGHIDILRYQNGKIGVWDFKPGAHREKNAASQVFRYIKLMMKALHLPPTAFVGGYFDKDRTYYLSQFLP